MIELMYGKKYNKPVVLALGFYDSIHKGHRLILDKVKMLSSYYNCMPTVMTYLNNPYQAMNKNTKLVYSYEERILLLEEYGIEAVLQAVFDESYKNTSELDFLQTISNNLDIKHIVCGYDFKFGKNAQGNTLLLKKYCIEKGIGLHIISKTIHDKRRISSTVIRNSLIAGKITKANELLCEPYFIKGKVVHGRNIGSKMLYPTINIEYDNQKVRIKDGVYSTLTQIDDKTYISVTNCGNKPTFNNDVYDVETYILDYQGDLYGKDVITYFLDRLRDIKKFDNTEKLKEQITKDIEQIKILKMY